MKNGFCIWIPFATYNIMKTRMIVYPEMIFYENWAMVFNLKLLKSSKEIISITEKL